VDFSGVNRRRGDAPVFGAKMENGKPQLLAIVELGGYPNLAPLYKRLGFEVELVGSQRKAQAYLKRRIPDVIVAEFNFQSDFRDRTSNLETLMARLQKHPEVKVICFYQREFQHKFDELNARFPVFEAIYFPVAPERVEAALQRALADG
jgi:DNA-binding NtrC family response regulator